MTVETKGLTRLLKNRVRRVRQSSSAFSFHSTVDPVNSRLLVHQCAWGELALLVDELAAICRKHELDKLIIQAEENQWMSLLQMGFQLEGTIPHFFQGRPVYYMCKFYSEERQSSSGWKLQEQILEQVLTPRKKLERKPLPSNLQPKLASVEDVGEMVTLFKQVFATYPSPLTDQEYLANSLEDHLFVIVRDGDRIISSASAEIDREAGNAEMTNCATLPEYRRVGLMQHQFDQLEQELKKQGIRSLFSIARARSLGMNRVLHRRGYGYRGRLVNNCDICGGFEDMNLWSKQLR